MLARWRTSGRWPFSARARPRGPRTVKLQYLHSGESDFKFVLHFMNYGSIIFTQITIVCHRNNCAAPTKKCFWATFGGHKPKNIKIVYKSHTQVSVVILVGSESPIYNSRWWEYALGTFPSNLGSKRPRFCHSRVRKWPFTHITRTETPPKRG